MLFRLSALTYVSMSLAISRHSSSRIVVVITCMAVGAPSRFTGLSVTVSKQSEASGNVRVNSNKGPHKGGVTRVTHMAAQSGLVASRGFQPDLGSQPGRRELHTRGTVRT